MAKNYQSEYSEDRRELRQQGTPLFPIAIYSGDLLKESVPMHWHEAFEAGVVTQGVVCLHVGSETLTLREGDGYFINLGAPHAFTPGEDPKSAQHSFVFDPSLVGGRMDSVFYQKYCQPLLTHREMQYRLFERESAWQSDAIGTIRRVWTTVNDAFDEYELDARHMLSHLLSLLRAHMALRETVSSEKSLRDSERIKLMIRYIQEHYMEAMTIVEIAGAAMISHSECLRCFHDTVGVTPLHYLRSYRIQKACELLNGSSLSIAEVTAACGFEDMSYFSKVFKSEKKCTPGDYRRNGGRNL